MRLVYRKIPNISPGLIEVRKPFLEGLYSGGGLYSGVYIRDFTVYVINIDNDNSRVPVGILASSCDKYFCLDMQGVIATSAIKIN